MKSINLKELQKLDDDAEKEQTVELSQTKEAKESAKKRAPSVDLQKYNPDHDHIVYELAKKKKQINIDEGIYEKVKQGMIETMTKFADQ